MSEDKSKEIPKLKKDLKQEKLVRKMDIDSDEDDDLLFLEENGEFVLNLGQPKKKLKVTKFKDSTIIHFRQHYEKDGKWLPTTKGMTINPHQWQIIKDHFKAIDKAIEKLK